MSATATAPEPELLLQPFFANEGGYCHLLNVLFTSPVQLARDFRKKFSERILRPKLGIEIGCKPIRITPEMAVSAPGEGTQAIDLVADLEQDIVGIEVKVFTSSARSGQLAAQYHLLRADARAAGKRVHSLLIFPNATNHHVEVRPEKDGDRAESVTWADVFDCLPRFDSVESNLLLGAIVEQARTQQQVLKLREPKTAVTHERMKLKLIMKRTIARFSKVLSESDTPLHGCTWNPSFWRDPPADSYYGPVIGPSGGKHNGQYLTLKVQYPGTPAENPKEFLVTVSFTLERRGGAVTYLPEFNSALPGCLHELPPAAGIRKVGREGTEIYDELTLSVGADGAATVSGMEAEAALADLLLGYARAFSSFLLRDSRLPRHRAIGASNGS